jgi:hypothetical protein
MSQTMVGETALSDSFLLNVACNHTRGELSYGANQDG